MYIVNQEFSTALRRHLCLQRFLLKGVITTLRPIDYTTHLGHTTTVAGKGSIHKGQSIEKKNSTGSSRDDKRMWEGNCDLFRSSLNLESCSGDLDGGAMTNPILSHFTPSTPFAPEYHAGFERKHNCYRHCSFRRAGGYFHVENSKCSRERLDME